MVRTDFSSMRCPVARSMEVLGERWAILVLREAYYGTRRFDEFQRHLGIAPNILSARLKKLVDYDLLARVPSETPGARHEYRLTEKGRDFFPVYVAIKRWGDRWMGDPAGQNIVMLDAISGDEIVPPPLLRADGAPMGPEDVRILPGPGATDRLRRRFAPAEGSDARGDDEKDAHHG